LDRQRQPDIAETNNAYLHGLELAKPLANAFSPPEDSDG
jgi:hypothetical protein